MLLVAGAVLRGRRCLGCRRPLDRRVGDIVRGGGGVGGGKGSMLGSISSSAFHQGLSKGARSSSSVGGGGHNVKGVREGIQHEGIGSGCGGQLMSAEERGRVRVTAVTEAYILRLGLPEVVCKHHGGGGGVGVATVMHTDGAPI